MLRVLTWNIRNGGGDRLPLIREVLAVAGAQLVALQELRGFDRARLATFAAGLGLRAVFARALTGQPVAVLYPPDAVLLDAFRLRRPLHHAAAGLTVATSAGPLTVVGTHLYPYSGWWRRIEVGWLTARAAREERHRPARQVLLLGDLNSLDPGTDHRAELAALSPVHRDRHLTRRGAVDTRAVAALHSAGLVDLYESTGAYGQRHTVPTPGARDRPWGGEFARMRLDYAFASPDLASRARACRILVTPATRRASDHYPLLIDFDLELAPAVPGGAG